MKCIKFVGDKYNHTDMIDILGKFENIGPSHMSAPNDDGGLGFGGHCFPKDLQAILNLAEDLDTTSNVLQATRETNITVRKNRDWEKMKGRAVT